jgi:hypothetical protein
MEAFEGIDSLVGEVRLAQRCDSTRKEARSPFFVLGFPGSCFLPLPFFQFLLQFGRLSILLGVDCISNIGPEPSRLVRELGRFGRDNFRRHGEGHKVYQEILLLHEGGS